MGQQTGQQAGRRRDKEGTVWVLVPRLPMRYTRRDAWCIGFMVGCAVTGTGIALINLLIAWGWGSG